MSQSAAGTDRVRVAAPVLARRRAYWAKTRWITLLLLGLWFLVTFLPAYYARELNDYEFLGFPLGFYILAQGSQLVYLAIVGVYAKLMNRLDRHYPVVDTDPASGPPPGAR